MHDTVIETTEVKRFALNLALRLKSLSLFVLLLLKRFRFIQQGSVEGRKPHYSRDFKYLKDRQK